MSRHLVSPKWRVSSLLKAGLSCARATGRLAPLLFSEGEARLEGGEAGASVLVVDTNLLCNVGYFHYHFLTPVSSSVKWQGVYL